jgi:hypothetical protein
MSSNAIIKISNVARLRTIGKIEAFNEELFVRPGQSRQGGR